MASGAVAKATAPALSYPLPGQGRLWGCRGAPGQTAPVGGMPMRVLQVVGSAEGGLRRHLVQLLRGLAGHRFVVAGPPAVLAGLDALPAVEALWPLPGGGGYGASGGDGRVPGAHAGDGQSPPFDLVHVQGCRPAWAVSGKMALAWPTVWNLHTRPPAGVLARLWLGRLF